MCHLGVGVSQRRAVASRHDERIDRVTAPQDESGIAVGSTLPVQVVRLDSELPLPGYAHEGDAGADLVARIEVLLEPNGGRAMVCLLYTSDAADE